MNEKKRSIGIDFFRQLDRFTFMVRKRVSTAYAGSRRSVHSGRGIDTVGYRQYYHGDEIRSIDWNVYARTEKLYVRQYEEEKSLTTHILLDSSKSMDYSGNDGVTKFEYGAMIAAGFAYLVTKDNDKFAISTFSENVDISKPKRGREYLIRTIDHLSEIELGGQTSIEESMIQYTPAIRSRSLVVIISDFLDDPESIESAIYRFSNHDLILVQVLDKTEIEIPVHGNSKLIDLETESELKTYISESFKKEYKEQLEDHINKIREVCDHVGADFYTFNTDVPIFDAFFYTISRRR